MSDNFASAQVMEGRGDVLGVTHGDDTNFVVEFYLREIEDEQATRIHGRRILKGRAYCKKYAVGDPRTVWDAPVSDLDKMRFSRQWAAYERGEAEMVVGTPLEAWPLLNGDQRLALKNAGFKTVDQIAAVSDGAISNMQHGMGPFLQNVRGHAQKFLSDQDAGEAERRLTEQLKARDNEVAAMKAQMEAMALQMQRLQEAQALGPVPAAQQLPPPETAPQLSGELADTPAPGLDALASLPELEPAEPEPTPAKPVSRKLSDEAILDIQTSQESAVALAERYDVTPETVRRYRKAA